MEKVHKNMEISCVEVEDKKYPKLLKQSLKKLQLSSGPKKLYYKGNFCDEIFDISVAWGSLHYSDKEGIIPMLSEIKRITKTGGILLATLRNDRDTYLKNGKHLGNNTWQTGLDDLTGTIVSFYTEDEMKGLFRGFSELRYGWMERTIIGDTSKVISHWIIAARK